MADDQATILAVHERADGYWYIGAGRSIAEGPYRYPQQVLSVAADLLAAASHWRIEVFDPAGNQVIRYSSDETAASALGMMHKQREWSRVPAAEHTQ